MEHDAVPLYPQNLPPHQIIQKDAMHNQHLQPSTNHQSMPGPKPLVLLGPENTVTTCPFCHASIKTAVKYTTTTRTHMAAALCGMICCCCCIPYSLDSAKNADHYCPNCQRYIGTYEK